MPTGGDIESTVEEFIELEAELTDAETGSVGSYDEGTIAEATKVAVDEVPDEYPLAIATPTALKLVVDTEGGTVPVYLEWPEPGQEVGDVERLLDALDRDPDEFASIYGDRVALDAEAGWHYVDFRRTAGLSGSEYGGLDAGDLLDSSGWAVAGAIAALALGFLLTGFDSSLGPPMVLVGWIGLPLSVYYDLDQVPEDHGWDPNVVAWVGGAVVLVVNISVGLAYLVERFVRTRVDTPDEVARVRYRAIAAGAVGSVAALLVAGLSPALGALLWIAAMLFLPILVYQDASHLAVTTDWDPEALLWAVGTAVAAVSLLGFLAAGAYLFVRSQALD